MNKQIIIIVAVVALIGLGFGGWYYFSQSSKEAQDQPTLESGVGTQPQATPSPSEIKPTEVKKELSTVGKITARSFAEKVLKLLQSRDYGKIYDLLTDEDKAAESRTEYVKRVTETSGGITITSWQIKEVLEEPSGASVQCVVHYESVLGGGSGTGILTLVQKNGKWFLSIGAVDIAKATTKGVGDEIVLATIKFKVNAVTERQTISNQYGSSASAKDGTKFIVVDITITNLTKSGFLFPAEAFMITDNQDRKFETYRNTIGNIDNYLNVRELSPSIPEKGVVVYEIPTDATNYSFIVAKSGTNEVYKIILK